MKISEFAMEPYRVRLERVPIHTRCSFTREVLADAKITAIDGYATMLDRMTYQLDAYLLALPEHEQTVVAHAEKIECGGEWVRWPKDWKSAWRESLGGWFGRWVRRRWPVAYAEKQVRLEVKAVAHAEEKYHPFKAVCPHLRAPGQDRHVEWLYLMDTVPHPTPSAPEVGR